MKTPKFLSSLPTRADLVEMRAFLLLWSTQALSSLGSSMTAFALVVWSYEAEGSALTTALLSVCSYAPYVLVSVFAGALSDRWNKKAVLLICDGFAALTTLLTLLLLCTGRLQIWHLYALNALSGLMNSVQQPASEVTTTLLTPRAQFQRAASLRALSSSVVNLATPALAAAVLGFAGLPGVIAFDLATFAVAALTLAFGIRLPKAADSAPREESLPCRRARRAALPLAPRGHPAPDPVPGRHQPHRLDVQRGAARAHAPAGQAGYGLVGSVSGAAMLAGSALAVLLPAPKRRARDLRHAPALDEHGELPAGAGALSPALVRGRGAGLDRHPADERQPRRAAAPPCRWRCRAASTPRATPCSSSRSRWGTCWAARWWTR